MPRVTVGVARYRTFTARFHVYTLSGLNVQAVTGNDDVFFKNLSKETNWTQFSNRDYQAR